MRCHPLRDSQPFLLGLAGRAFERFPISARVRFNPTTCCHAASTPIGKENPTCHLAADGIVQVHAPNYMPARHRSWWPRPARVMRDGMGPRHAPVSARRLFRPRPRMRGFLPDRERAHPTFLAPVVQRFTGFAPVPPLQAAMPSPAPAEAGFRDEVSFRPRCHFPKALDQFQITGADALFF
jgi:hypothetical protein